MLAQSHMYIDIPCKTLPTSAQDACVKKNGVYAAMKLTGSTNNLQLMLHPNTNQVPVLYTNEEKFDAQRISDGDTGLMFSHLATTCNTGYTGLVDRETCKARRIPELFLQKDSQLTTFWSGGLNVFICLWVSTHISVTFLTVWGRIDMGTYGKYFEYVRLMFLALWFLIGMILPLVFYLFDRYMHLGVPFSNVILAWIMQVYVYVVMYTWYVDGTISSETSDETVSSAVESLLDKTGHAEASAAGGRVHSMMRLTVPPANASYTGGLYSAVQTGAKPGVVTSGRVSRTFDIIDKKLMSTGSVEIMCIEAALTFPLAFAAFFGMAMRDTLDIELQSILIRSFLVFMGFGILDRMHNMASKSNHAKYYLTEALLSGVVIIGTLAMYLVYDMLWPTWKKIPSGPEFFGAKNALVFAVIFLCVVTLTMFIYFIITAFAWKSREYSSEHSAHVFLFAVMSLGINILRIVISAYLWDMKTWYGSWDKLDMPLNYN